MPPFGRRVYRPHEAVLGVLISAVATVFGLLAGLRWIPIADNGPRWFFFVFAGCGLVNCIGLSMRLVTLLRARRRRTHQHDGGRPEHETGLLRTGGGPPVFGSRFSLRPVGLAEAVTAVLGSASLAVFGLLWGLHVIPDAPGGPFPFVFAGVSLAFCAWWIRWLVVLARARRRAAHTPGGDHLSTRRGRSR